MTCVNCGSPAIQPNGWCSNCGQPASPPAPPQSPVAGWPPATAPAQPAPWAGQLPSWQATAEHPPSWQTPAEQPQSWQASPGQPSWATDATSTFGAPAQSPPSAPPAPTYPAHAAYQPPPGQQGPNGYPAPAVDATAVQSFPAHPQAPAFNPPPYGSAAQPYMVNSPYAHAVPAAKTGNPFSIAAFVLAAIAVLILPIVFSPLAAILAFVGIRRRERLGRLALILAIAGGLVGAILGIVLRSLITVD